MTLSERLRELAGKATQGAWFAQNWTRHAASSVLIDDASVVTGKRLLADCDNEHDAALIVALVNGLPELLEALKAKERSDAYAKVNPLGGPAVVFRAMANRIEAGEEYYSVLADYHFAAIDEALSEALEDARRMDELAAFVAKEPLLLHNGEPGMGYAGLGLANIGRTLRQAIDQSIGVAAALPKSRAIDSGRSA